MTRTARPADGTPAIAERDLVGGREKGLAVITAFDQGRPRLTISEVATLCGLSRAAARRYLLTLQHLVFARLTTEMTRAASDQAKQDAKSQGKGFFGQWGAVMGANRAIVEQYYQMPVEAILRQHPDNFVVPTSQVRKVTFSRKDSEMTSIPDEMAIHAASKLKFQLKGCSIGDARKALRQVLGDRVK